MLKTLLLCSFFVLLSSCSGPGTPFAKTEPQTTGNKQQVTDYHYEPEISVIQGILKTEMFYGPPNYGESPKTDSKEEAYILYLDAPIRVIALPKDSDYYNQTRDSITKIQLVPFTQNIISPHNGRHIRVTGPLWGAQTGHHHTDVLMSIQKVEKL
jgi:hypothetical protein